MKARCLCGATRFEVQLRNYEVAACHCSMCRRHTSGPLMSIDIENIHFIDQQHSYLLQVLLNGQSVVFAMPVVLLFSGGPKIIPLPILMYLLWSNCQRIWISI